MKKTCLILLLLIFALPTEAQKKPVPVKPALAEESHVNSWEKLTSWLRKRKNPFRTSSSDIVTRNRRHIQQPPVEVKDDKVPPPGNGKKPPTADEAGKRFRAQIERDLIAIQEAFDTENHQMVVKLATPFLSKLGDAEVGPSYIDRQQELLATVKKWRDDSREKIETLGMAAIKKNLEEMRQSFADEDYDTLRSLGGEVKEFVTGWEFEEAERKKTADLHLVDSEELVKRADLREEFSEYPIKVSFRIVSEDPDVGSTATINGKSRREGDILDDDGYILIKKITKAGILFDFKGEQIEYDME
jgi:hypothetical protein